MSDNGEAQPRGNALLLARREFLQKRRALGHASHHKRRVLAGPDETCAHVDVARHDRLVVDPRHPAAFGDGKPFVDQGD